MDNKSTRKLRMIFDTDDGKWVLSLTDPKEGLTASEVEAAMNTIISQNIFGIPPTAIVGAELVETGTTVLI